MQIVRVDAFGGPEALRLVTMEPPPLAEGELRIDVRACGVNRADILLRTGKYHGAQVPAYPGREAAGVVAEGGHGFTKGERVLAFRVKPGGYATQVNAPASRLVRIPEGVDFPVAASLSTSWLSAWWTLLRLAKLEKGETVLIQGAASAVGHAAVQIAKWKGARVIGAAGGPEKVAWLKSLGADEAIDYTAQDVVAEVQRITGGKGVEVALDAVGGKAFGPALKSLGYGGRCVQMANVTTEDSVVNTRDFYPKNATIMGFQISFLVDRNGWDPRPDLEEMMKLVASGALRVNLDRTFPLQAAADAHRWLEDRKNRGNVALVVTP
jgi:NADPH2:quinone reductase